MVSKGEHPVFEEVMKNLLERDYIDSHRETSPLRRASDAFVLNNSDMGLTEEIAWAEGLIRGKFGLLEAPEEIPGQARDDGEDAGNDGKEAAEKNGQA